MTTPKDLGSQTAEAKIRLSNQLTRLESAAQELCKRVQDLEAQSYEAESTEGELINNQL